jgi:hypothetical protein
MLGEETATTKVKCERQWHWCERVWSPMICRGVCERAGGERKEGMKCVRD